jgi:hypothetical protein
MSCGKKPEKPAPPGIRWVVCTFYVHYKTGKRVYPKKSRVFRFLVRSR